MKAKAWRVLEQAVEEGVGFGINRFLKHRDLDWIPDKEEVALRESIIEHVMTAACEWFSFDEDDQG